MHTCSVEKKMANSEKILRVAAIHDLSCFGRCALTVIIPVLSAMGIQCIPLPTAVLSTHTGGFDDMFVEPMTEQMKKIYTHWQELGIKFDAIYSGYLADEGQINTVEDFIEKFRCPDTLTLIDPVFADGGVYYSRTTDKLVEAMCELVRHADIATPNITEACFLCNVDYSEYENTKNEDKLKFAEEIIQKLYFKTNVNKIVITGIEMQVNDIDHVVTAATDFESKKNSFVSLSKVGGAYPGTGDLFSSVALGGILKGSTFENSVKEASLYTRETIEYSTKFDTPLREGVSLEPCLKKLIISN
jgi:pyridoxine kinase